MKRIHLAQHATWSRLGAALIAAIFLMAAVPAPAQQTAPPKPAAQATPPAPPAGRPKNRRPWISGLRPTSTATRW